MVIFIEVKVFFLKLEVDSEF